jgi:hypothetical protein
VLYKSANSLPNPPSPALSLSSHLFHLHNAHMSTASLMPSIFAPSTSVAPTTIATKLLALTTPFVQRPECASVWDLTSVSSNSDGTSTTITILASDAADARFASCQPSAWDNIVPTSRFSFSPAVCPSGWTYYAMASTESIAANEKDISTYSTAYCCARCV